MKRSEGMCAGVLGAVAMTMVMGMARLLGVGGNLEMTIGTMFTESISAGSWLLGFAIHLAFGAVFGLIYAAILSLPSSGPRAATGALVGGIHGVAATAAMALVPMFHPLITEVAPASMAFLSVGGALMFICLHVLFGFIVGGVGAQCRRGL